MDPFSKGYDWLFSSDRYWGWKVVGAGLFGLTSALISVVSTGPDKNNRLWGPVAVAKVIAIPLITMLLVCALVRADFVRRRLAANERVGVISRALFGAGIWSLFTWIAVILIVGFPLAIWFGYLTSGHAH
jgi:hypothetical protein